MTLALVTPPALEPLSLAQVKDHLRVTHDAEDALLADLLRAARLHVEFAARSRLLTQVWRVYADHVPPEGLALPVGPVQAVEVVTVFDADGTPTVLAASAYSLARGAEPACLVIDVPPAAAANGVEIDLRCGFGDLGVDVPDTLKRAILLLCAHWYEFRGVVHPSQQPVSMPPGFDTLVAPFAGVRL